MNQPVRSAISQEQQQIAARLKSLWLQHKKELQLTQTTAAETLGITQGSFTQFINCHIAVNTDFVLGMCRLLGVDPCDVHKRYGDLVFKRKEKR